MNSKFYGLVVSEWKANKCGARKLHEVMKHKGFGVSRRKIEQVLIKEDLQKPVLKRRKPRKYKRYEWPIPDYMHHTDWHVIKSEKMKGQNILVYIDDFINWYNDKRLSEALDYMTPNEAYKKRL